MNSSACSGPTERVPLSGAGGDASNSGSSGCFIATAAYGSYLDPHVTAFRKFRDDHFLTNAAGRVFVKTCYALSPPVADFIGRHESPRLMTRAALTPFIFGVKYPIAFARTMFLSAAGAIFRKRIAEVRA